MIEKNISIAVTNQIIDAGKSNIWKKIGFYEHVKRRPPAILRAVLPVPQEVDGRHNAVGDICRCKYSDGGYLTKRITRIDNEGIIEFEIIEQSIRYQESVKLLGGYIQLKEISSQQCVVTMLTYFENSTKPLHLFNFFIKWGIKVMHRFVMKDLQKQLHLLR